MILGWLLTWLLDMWHALLIGWLFAMLLLAWLYIREWWQCLRVYTGTLPPDTDTMEAVRK